MYVIRAGIPYLLLEMVAVVSSQRGLSKLRILS